VEPQPILVQAYPPVLVVDDDEMTRYIIRVSLEEAGFDIEEAINGRAALQRFQAGHYSLVVMDVVMPEISGFEACQKLRKLPQGQHVPVLMLTALDDVESIRQSYDAGATDFMNKPINPLILAHRVRYMLRATNTVNALRANQHRLRQAQRLAKLGHWEFNPVNGRINMSEQARQIFELPDGKQLLGMQDLLKFVHPDEFNHVSATLNKHLAAAIPFQLEYQIVLPDGSLRTLHQEMQPPLDNAGDPAWLAVVQDISERCGVEERVVRLAYFDNLTGLPNRALLLNYLTELISHCIERGVQFAVLSIDLDHFKRINNSWGQGTGNTLLQLVSGRMLACLHEANKGTPMAYQTINSISRRILSAEIAQLLDSPNFLARLGADEFIAILTGIPDISSASLIARRLKDAFMQPFELYREEVFVTVSIGVATFPSHGEDPETLLSNAETAMHHVKEKGRDGFQFYRQSLNVEARQRLHLENDLYRALDNNEFEVHYQPKVDCMTQRVVGVEALLRWRHPKRGLVSPAKFIPLTEETRMIVPIGEWVLQSACAEGAKWHKAGYPLRVAVNLSTRQFKKRTLAKTVADIISKTGMSSHLLELEITEGILMEDSELSQLILNELREIRLDIVLDDFGTGYSSLSYLKRFKPEALKIDRCFIQDVGLDDDMSAITAAILELSKCLRMRVVAEGVETTGQVEFLRKHECDEIQGFLFGSALPSAEFFQWLQANSEFAPQRTPELLLAGNPNMSGLAHRLDSIAQFLNPGKS
jgi:predicted signal transduction protein with EAL and GGDEF domain/DNA-binding response OmpR family regulator